MSRPTNIESTNWSGAVFTAHAGESFSTVSAQWHIPTVTQVPIGSVKTSDVSEWVGIDGYNSADVCQAGVMQVVHTSATGHTRVTCSAWDEWYPATANLIRYHYKFDFNYNAMGGPKPDSARSPEYSLKILDQ